MKKKIIAAVLGILLISATVVSTALADITPPLSEGTSQSAPETQPEDSAQPGEESQTEQSEEPEQAPQKQPADPEQWQENLYSYFQDGIDRGYLSKINIVNKLFTYPERMVYLNEPVTTVNHWISPDDNEPTFLPYTTTVRKAWHTKSLEGTGFDVSDVGYFSETDDADEDGTLTTGKSYLFVEMTVKNESDERQEIYLNGSRVSLLPGTGVETMPPEARLLDNWQYPPESGSHFRYIFEPQEETTFTLGYIVEDEYLDLPELFISTPGVNYGEDNGPARYILLNQQKPD